ncbi:MAG: ABC transporter ATP-binding protein [Gloeomargarita sp. DG_1_4_bins_134]
MTTPLLAATELCKSFGRLPAVRQVSLTVAPGSITGLIGPNGAGKTTLFNLLAGSLRPDSGQVLFQNQVITGLPPHRIAQQGLVRTFQVARVFSRLSVLENVLLAAPGQLGEQVWPLWLQPQRVAQQERQLRQEAMDILASVGLAAKAQDYAGALSGGQRKLLEMARALMTRPQLMLLDEPAAGVNPTLINQMCEYIQAWNQAGITFLIIEHNMDVIMSLCQQVWVLAEGKNLAVGTPGEIQTNPTVLAAYLGGGEEEQK